MKFINKLLQKLRQRRPANHTESAGAVAAEEKTLLICQKCRAQFVDIVNPNLKGDAASLPAALKAHRAGWVVADGQILCPACAGRPQQRVH
jgi:hypothetical protein